MMEVGEGRSSSVDLSSAPSSPPERPNPDTAASHRLPTTAPTSTQYASGDGYRNPSGPHMSEAALPPSRQEPPKKRQPRKPKDLSTAADTSKPKPVRKPRAAPGTATTTKRKPKAENNENQAPMHNIPPTAALKAPQSKEPYNFGPPPGPVSPKDEAAKITQNGFLSHDSSRSTPNYGYPPYQLNHAPQPQPQPQTYPYPPRTSDMYDPVRGITTQRQSDPPQTSITPSSTSTPPRPTSRAGASPLANLIDGPMPSYSSAPSPLRTFVTPTERLQVPQATVPTSMPGASGPMDVDTACVDGSTSRKPSLSKKPSSDGPTRATSPKPARAKEQPPPLPTGSGLLSASLFGGEIGVDTGNDSTAQGPNIVLHIDLKNPNNKVINFARLAEEKYGFDALYPRQAAQRKRLNEIAARGAVLERSASGSKHGGTSAGDSGEDDISVDIDRDSDNDGDVAMGGTNGTDQVNSGTDGPEPKRRRRRKVEDYDQDDPFIDDTEQIWEQQQAASKDGFFVYCGPLVPEGEKPAVERYALFCPYHLLLANTQQSRWDGQARSWTRQRRRTWVPWRSRSTSGGRGSTRDRWARWGAGQTSTWARFTRRCHSGSKAACEEGRTTSRRGEGSPREEQLVACGKACGVSHLRVDVRHDLLTCICLDKHEACTKPRS